MEQKKSPRADLEKKRFVLFQLGLITAMSVSLLAFEWASSYTVPTLTDNGGDVVEIPEDMIPPTYTSKPIPPKPKPQPKKKSTTIQPVKQVLVAAPDNSPDLSDNFDPDDLFGDEDQDNTKTSGPVETTPFVVVERMPVFCGCEKQKTEAKRQQCSDRKRLAYLKSNTRFPHDARDMGISEKVYVGYVVDENGQITDVHLKSKNFPSLGHEAMRLVKNLPCMAPGEQRGQKVPVSFVMPIQFTAKH